VYGTLTPTSILLALACGFLSILWMPLVPLLMFKPEVRTLEVNQEGISSKIGKRSGKRSWREILSITEDSGCIIFQVRNGNAFIVPPRAFDTIEDRQRFKSFAESAFAGSAMLSR
jgi:hypothetical protein